MGSEKMSFFGKKGKNNKKSDTDGLNWRENPLYESKEQTQSNPMNAYLQDMDNSKTRHYASLARFFSKGDSKEYTDVKSALSDVVQYTNGSLSNDAAVNSQMMSDAAKSYHNVEYIY